MKKLKFFLSLLMLFTFSIGQVWAVNYELMLTLDVTQGAPSGSTSTNLTDATLLSYLQGAAPATTDITAASKTGDVYKGKGSGGSGIPQACLKIGKASGGGSISFTIADSFDKVTKVVVTGYSWKDGSTISVNSADGQTTTAATEHDFVFEGLTGTKTISIDVTTSAVCVTSIKLYKTSTSSNPSVSSDKSSIEFGTVLTGTLGPNSTEYIADTFTITGANLNANVNLLATTLPAGAIFSVDPTSVTPSDKSINQQVVVWAQTGVAGEFNGRVVISSAAGTPEFTNDTIPVHINVIDPVTSYDIDFEYNSLAPYTNWNFSNIACATATIDAHAGSTYYGNTGGKTSASITTKAKVALPGTLTFYVSKESTNTTASYWKVQVSENGSAWTDVESFEAQSMTKGVWNECEADLSDYSNVYVRISYGSSGAVRAIDDISLAMRAAAAVEAPTISGTTPFYPSTTVTLSCLTDGAEIRYTTDGSDPKAVGIVYTAPFTITESCTVMAVASKDAQWSDYASKTFTKATPLTTMDEIFAAATAAGSTATDKYITFNNWVVSGVTTNGKSVYLTDGIKGLIIFDNGGSMGFSAGDILSGTVACKVQLYNGSSEITALNSSTEGLTITTGGVITPVVLDEAGIAALTGVNTGSVITISGACTVESSKSYVAGVQLYNSLFEFTAPTAGKNYTATGVYVLYNTTKEILPRSAADIVLVKEAPDLSWSAATGKAYTVAKDAVLPSLTNPHSLTVTYSSTDEAKATVNASTGAITPVAAGTTTIKATFAGDATYAAAEVSYELTVLAPIGVDLSGTQTKTAFEYGDHFNPATDGDYTVEVVFVASPRDAYDVTSEVTWDIDGKTLAQKELTGNGSAALTATWNELSDWQYIDITINKHKVTFSAPEHGTLVIKNFGSAIASGDEFVKTREFTVEATPADGYQLATLTAGGVDIKSTKAFTMGTEDIAVVATFEEIPHVYSVVGVASVIPVGWDPAATATEMTLNEGVYSYKVEDVVLAAGTNYEWKIVEDHAWTVSYPQSGNASFSVDKNGRYDVTFTLNKSTKAYAATPELLEEIAVNRTFAVLGTFNSWSATAEEGASDVATLSFTVNIAATGDYAFKVKVNDAWLGNGATYNRDNTGATITENGDDMTLHVDQDGEYTFTWTFASNALSITYPALKANPELSWNGIDEYNRAWAYREGKPFEFPTLVKPDGVSVTYSSDDGGTIITINETTGAITLLSEGVAHITATSAANDTYNAGTATYTLYVCGITSISLGGEAEKLTYEYGDAFDRTGLTATLHFNNGGTDEDVTELATWTYDKETITSGGSVHVTVSYLGQEDDTYVYNVKVAAHAVTWTQPAVGGTFEVLDNTSNPFASGKTFRKGIEITVVPSAAPNYELATLTANGADIKSTKKYTIGTEDVVIAATFVKVPVAAGLEWSTSNAYVRKGSALNEFPTLSNPNGIEGITYESTDESIATIHASTGAISLLANGETTLKAIFAGNDDYLAQTVECTLHVAAGIVTITPAAPVALELGNVPFGSTRADYGQSFHLNITNLISGQYNQVKIDFTGSAFWTAGNNYITDNDQDGVIDVDVTIVPSEYWWSLSEANALGEQNTTITLMCTGSAQFEDVVVGTATMNVVASIPTGIDNAEAQEKVQKMIKNGMLVIIKNGQEFNVFGEKIK